MAEQAYNCLFLCTQNSARSVLAEGLLNHLGHGRFKGYSAGSHPSGKVNLHALQALSALGIATEGLRSKAWDEFAAPGAPQMDFIITVCDDAAGEACPIWPGRPATAHWGVNDPSRFEGSEIEKLAEFRRVADVLERRIRSFLNIRFDRLSHSQVNKQLQAIGQVD